MFVDGDLASVVVFRPIEFHCVTLWLGAETDMADWRDNLSQFMGGSQASETEPEPSEFERFILHVALPAFRSAKVEFESHGRQVTIREAEASAVIIVNRDNEEELSYRLSAKTLPTATVPIAAIRYRERKGRRYVTKESMLRSGGAGYNVTDISETEVIEHLVTHYVRYAGEAS